MTNYKTIAESKKFIVLDQYTPGLSGERKLPE